MFSGKSITELEALPTYKPGFHNKECKKMLYRSFGNTGLMTSLLGFGGATLALCAVDVKKKEGGRLLALCDDNAKEKEGIETVISAIKSGINYIDTAPFYGQGKAEIVLGKALKHIPRSTYYLATKVGRYGPDVSNMFDFSAERTLKSVDESLMRLGVDYFDVLQVHDLEFAPSVDVILDETLPVLQKMKEMGKAKYIGITGYPLCKLKEILEKSTVPIDVVLSYCRYTLFDDSLKSYIPYFKEKKLAVVCAASLGMGLLTNKGPPDWHPASQEIKDACLKAAKICRNENADISKLALCHALSESEDIHTHLVGMENQEVLKGNLESLWNGLSEHELAVKQEIIKIFDNLQQRHWENVEVQQYKENLSCIGTT